MRISLPIQLLAVILFVGIFGGFVPFFATKTLYTFSFVFKEFLSFILPLIIFSFVLSGILSLKKNAPIVLLVLIACIFISNALVALVTFGIMNLMVPYLQCDVSIQELINNTTILEPLFNFSLPTMVRSEHALIVAIGGGLFFSFFQFPSVEEYAEKMKRAIEYFLLYCFIPLLPMYVLGFLIKLKYEGMFVTLAKHYGSAFFLIVGVQISYLIWRYFVASGFSFNQMKDAIINALPSYLTAFGTMSSAVTVPVSIEGAVKNTGSRPLANLAMPIMANVHLQGDSIGTPILAMVTMFLFFGHLPDFLPYVTFVFYFCTSMFAVSGIPGGGILVMIPILVSVLGFNPAMIGIITALYLLLDPFFTAANVMGDGALVMVVHRLVRRFL